MRMSLRRPWGLTGRITDDHLFFFLVSLEEREGGTAKIRRFGGFVAFLGVERLSLDIIYQELVIGALFTHDSTRILLLLSQRNEICLDMFFPGVILQYVTDCKASFLSFSLPQTGTWLAPESMRHFLFWIQPERENTSQ